MTVQISTTNQKCVQQQSGGQGSEQIHVVLDWSTVNSQPHPLEWTMVFYTWFHVHWWPLMSAVMLPLWINPSWHKTYTAALYCRRAQPHIFHGPPKINFHSERKGLIVTQGDSWMTSRLGRQGELHCFSVLSPSLTVNNNSPTRKSTKKG